MTICAAPAACVRGRGGTVNPAWPQRDGGRWPHRLASGPDVEALGLHLVPGIADERAMSPFVLDDLYVRRDGHGLEQREVLRGTRWDKWLYRGIGPLFSLLIVAGLVNPGNGGNAQRALLAGLVVQALASTWRGWRLGTIEISPRGLQAYGALRRWHWAWSELDHVEVGSGALPFAPATSNQPLVVYCRDGRVKRLTSINGKSHVAGERSWVTIAAARINDRIHSERPTPTAS
jgi:hypothetical protein